MKNKLSYLADRFIQHLKNGFKKREPKRWVFGEWFGERVCDNSYYLANYIAEEHPEIELFWIAKKNTNVSSLNKNITVLEMDSKRSISILKSASVAVMNQGFIDFSSLGIDYFRNCVTVNLWHGLAWKKINYDAKQNSLFANLYHKLCSKFENAEYFLVPSREAGTKFESAFLLDNDKEIFAGYPRNSFFYRPEKIEIIRQAILSQLNLPKETKIITYMPTFRDKTNSIFSFVKLRNNQLLIKILHDNNAIIIEKSHFISAQRNDENKEKSKYIYFIDNVGASELLAASDILITDYSSCFFDFLLLNHPIIHYLYDYDYYVNMDRGVYYSKEEVACGKTPENEHELFNAIEEYLKHPDLDEQLRVKQRQIFWEFDTCNSNEQIYQSICEILQKNGKS